MLSKRSLIWRFLPMKSRKASLPLRKQPSGFVSRRFLFVGRLDSGEARGLTGRHDSAAKHERVPKPNWEFGEERRPLLGGSAVESSCGCGALASLTRGRGREFSLAGCERKALRGRFPGRIFVAVCFGWENTFLF